VPPPGWVANSLADKANAAITWMKETHPSSTGSLTFLRLDLNDLEGIKDSAQEFLSKEKRLDVLWNNAGVMIPPQGSTTKQNYDMQLGTNCIAPFLFTKLLTPLLIQTAKSAEPGSVRVVWVSSSAAHLGSPTGGVNMKVLDGGMEKKGVQEKYAISKGGNILHALEFAKRHQNDGIVSVVSSPSNPCPLAIQYRGVIHGLSMFCPSTNRIFKSLNPGNLKSELQRHINPIMARVLDLMLYPAVNGAYTEFFAGLSPEVSKMEKGNWVVPFGRIMPLRKDYADGGNAEEFWEWSDKQVERYL
jgi:retinol dehydrogenase-12